jgi:hypothetical protein
VAGRHVSRVDEGRQRAARRVRGNGALLNQGQFPQS